MGLRNVSTSVCAAEEPVGGDCASNPFGLGVDLSELVNRCDFY